MGVVPMIFEGKFSKYDHKPQVLPKNGKKGLQKQKRKPMPKTSKPIFLKFSAFQEGK